MIVVMQCAGSKQAGAGSLKARDGRPVSFVAHPELATPVDGTIYAHPDDASDGGGSWRDQLISYNGRKDDNQLGLLPAYALYKNPVYRTLVDRYGIQNVFILSAGWGLINAGYLLPTYDVTFSSAAEKHVRRRPRDVYLDIRQLNDDCVGPILFFGSKEYVPLFAALTQSARATRHVFYASEHPPDAPGCVLTKYETRTRTNWQYECVAAFMSGRFAPPVSRPNLPD